MGIIFLQDLDFPHRLKREGYLNPPRDTKKTPEPNNNNNKTPQKCDG